MGEGRLGSFSRASAAGRRGKLRMCGLRAGGRERCVRTLRGMRISSLALIAREKGGVGAGHGEGGNRGGR